MRGDQRAQPLGAARLRRDRRIVLQLFGEQHLEQRQQQPRIGVWADRNVLERARGLGVPGIDDDDAAAAIDDPPEPSRMRGAVRRLPCDTSGLAPTIRSSRVYARSGIGTAIGAPYRSSLATSRLFASCEPGL